uniref:(northern house mosquito) hypothetical protein n=1 Tax=Culex pipiens TaxID=7175 RepID=A0A8D8C1A1_CULPI
MVFNVILNSEICSPSVWEAYLTEMSSSYMHLSFLFFIGLMAERTKAPVLTVGAGVESCQLQYCFCRCSVHKLAPKRNSSSGSDDIRMMLRNIFDIRSRSSAVSNNLLVLVI